MSTPFLSTLNPAQRSAATHPGGPLLVLAGPGTGKTQVLVARVLHLVLAQQVPPHKILCLTFTDAGAITLRQRLEGWLPAGLSRVAVHTFHSFCNELIQENEALFYLRAAEPVDELEQTNIVSQLLDELPAKHLLKRLGGNAYYDVPDLLHLFRTIKREALEPATLLDLIEKEGSQLLNEERFYYQRNGPGYEKGQVKQVLLAEEETNLNRLSAAVQLSAAYHQALRRRGRYDFEDMVMLVIQELTANPALRLAYQERYDHWLVDEFQDGSGAQNRLIELLTAHEHLPNLLAVGDDDQSIYRFQGASVANMLDLHHRFGHHLTTVVLTENYRSSQPILDAAARLIAHNQARLVSQLPGLTKQLVARRGEPKAAPPQAFSLQNPEAEWAWLVAELKQRLQASKADSMAILCRDNQQVATGVAALRSAGLPVQSRQELNLLAEPIVQDVISLLRFVDMELDVAFAGDANFYQLLHLPWLGVPAVAIANAALQASASRPAKTLRATVLAQTTARADLFSSSPEPSALVAAARKLDGLINLGAQASLPDLLQGIFDHTGLVSHLLEQPGRSFQQFMEGQLLRHPGMHLHGFLQVLDRMKAASIALPMPWLDGPEPAIQLMTVHASKGLEFDQVFLVGCTADKWESRRVTKRPFTLPKALLSAASSPSDQRDEEEERRLFYVALSRARKTFMATHPLQDARGRSLAPSRFLSEMLEGASPEVVPPSEAAQDSYLVDHLLASRPTLSAPELGYVQRVVKNFRMSATALNNYLDCPLRFYHHNILKVPSGRNEYSSFGTAVHAALEQLFRRLRSQNNVFSPVEDFLGWFEEAMADLRSFFSPEQYANRLVYGREVLAGYYAHQIARWNKIVSVEKNISALLDSRIPLTGKLDKLEFDGRLATIVDYKTGRYERARTELQAPGPAQPLGGNYWRQAVFYKLLVEADDRLQWQVREVQFHYVEPVKPGDYRRWALSVSAEDEALVRQQIEEVWAKVQAHDFYTGCGRQACPYCQLARRIPSSAL